LIKKNNQANTSSLNTCY